MHRFIILFLSALLLAAGTSAQDTSIEINGVIESIDGDTIIVNGLPITFGDVDVSIINQLVAGATIRISGDLQKGTVIAITIEIINMPEPEPVNPAIDVEKFVSIDGGGTWQDADTAPGPEVDLGTDVKFRLVVTNIGESDLTGITLSDNVIDTAGCVIPDILTVGTFFECNLGPFPAIEGQHSNIATVTGQAGDIVVSNTDGAHYFGGDRPSITLEKFVSDDGSSWADADTAPGPEIDLDDEVFFRFMLFNDGNVPLTSLTLSDDTFDVGSCVLPAELAPGETVDCAIGPFPVVDGQHTNIATATASYSTETVVATDSANYFGGELDDDDDSVDLPITIVVEGPVENTNVNIITIFDIDIEVNIDDPILNIIQIGDVIRVEGDLVDNADTIIIVAINIIIIDIDIYISDDGTDVWRDDGNCANGPPPWAPAHGWRRKCEGGNNNDAGSHRTQRSNKRTKKSSKKSS